MKPNARGDDHAIVAAAARAARADITGGLAQRHLLAVLEKNDGNRTATAAELVEKGE